MRLSPTSDAAARLGGFSQAFGYALGALGPLLVGVLFSMTSEWTASLLFLAATGVAAIAAAVVLYRVVPEGDGH